MHNLTLHPSARDRFDELGTSLLVLLRKESQSSFQKSPKSKFRPDSYVVDTFTEKEIKSLKPVGSFNPYTAEPGEVEFFTKGGVYVLPEEATKPLSDLTNKISLSTGYRGYVSIEVVRSGILDWIRDVIEHGQRSTLCNFMQEKLCSEIQAYKISIPIQSLHVESEITFGKMTLTHITSDFMTRWEEDARKYVKESDRDIFKERTKNERAKLQGLARATVEITAHADCAAEMALDLVEGTLDLLRFFCPENYFPQAASYCRPLGTGSFDSFEAWFLDQDEIPTREVGGIRRPFPVSWSLSEDEVNKLRRLGFDDLSAIAQGDDLSPFERDLETALRLYGKSSLAKTAEEKLVFLLVSLEFLLLRDQSENIQQNVGERLAYILSESGSKRRDIVRAFKSAYSIRSRFVHHGETPADYNSLNDLMFMAWDLFHRLILNREKFQSTSDLFDHVERLKFGQK